MKKTRLNGEGTFSGKTEEVKIKMKLLIVDDDPLMRAKLIYLLAEWGYEADAVGNGIQAWSLLQSQKEPVIILLDWIMPEMNGIELCQRLQSHPCRNRFFIILITSFNTKEAIVTGLNAGADDFISKPIHDGELCSRIAVGRRSLEYQHALETLTEELKIANQQLQQLVLIDPLTGIANRRLFDERFKTEWRRALLEKQPISLILLDLDFFKHYNDAYGHLAGDDCLRRVAEALSANVYRTGDLVARVGGEEFSILLPNADRTDVLAVAEAIRSEIFELNIKHERSPYQRMTASVGATTMLPDKKTTPDVLIAMADGAMYQAKASGRNNVKQSDATLELAMDEVSHEYCPHF